MKWRFTLWSERPCNSCCWTCCNWKNTVGIQPDGRRWYKLTFLASMKVHPKTKKTDLEYTVPQEVLNVEGSSQQGQTLSWQSQENWFGIYRPSREGKCLTPTGPAYKLTTRRQLIWKIPFPKRCWTPHLDRARIVPNPGPSEKKIWVAAAIHTWNVNQFVFWRDIFSGIYFGGIHFGIWFF